MTIPSVNITQLDGALGVLPSSAGKLLAVVGASSSGTTVTPATYARVTDLTAAFGDGPLVEAAARCIQRTGRPVVVVRTAAATNVGAYGTPVDGVTGTSTVTVDTDVEPYDDYDVIFEVIAGGTIGVAGITYRVSLDNGNNYSAVTGLGTANSVTLIGNCGLDFGAGTLVAGDTFTFRTTAPRWDDTELLAGLNALSASAVNWGIVHVVGDTSATSAGVIETWMQGINADGKHRTWIANTRLPTSGESEATYLSSLTSAWSSFTTIRGAMCAGAADIISSVSGRNYRRPIAHHVASAHVAVDEQVNLAAIDTGSAAGVNIRDAAGNPRHHDESINPGLDDLGFCVLRTWDQEPGVFINIPRIFSGGSSDFRLIPHRRVMNLGIETIDAYMRRRLNKEIRVNPTTGYIAETEAKEIESTATKILQAALTTPRKASSVSFVLSRTDNILSTRTLTADVRIVPLAYPETITQTVGFSNPALAAVTA